MLINKQLLNIKENIATKLTLNIIAQKAGPQRPTGPMLEQIGVKVRDFAPGFNKTTEKFEKGLPLKVLIITYKDSNYDYFILGVPINFLIKNILKYTNKNFISLLDLYKLVKLKTYENNYFSEQTTLKNILSTLKSMNIYVETKKSTI